VARGRARPSAGSTAVSVARQPQKFT
jgi:hypothetical protein